MTFSNSLSVSAIIPAYNRADTIERAVRCALAETIAGDEVLVIDDGSTDGTRAKVEAIGSERVRYIWQANAGAGSARNCGAREATGDLVAYLDSDDEWLPGKIDLQRRFMAANPDVLFCFTDFAGEVGGVRHHAGMSAWHEDSRPWDQILAAPVNFSSVAELPTGMPDCAVFIGDLYRNEMTHNYILTSSIMIRRKEAGDAMRFTEGIKIMEDWGCFGRLAAKGKAAYIACETAVQYGHPGERISDADLLLRSECRVVVLREVWGSDSDFLAKSRDEYLALLNHLEVSRVRGLLIHGRCLEARSEIQRLDGVPAGYRILSHLPGPLVSSVLNIRRTMNSILGS